jgi:hypothetical protein
MMLELADFGGTVIAIRAFEVCSDQDIGEIPQTCVKPPILPPTADFSATYYCPPVVID